jgi:hypothetical protein
MLVHKYTAATDKHLSYEKMCSHCGEQKSNLKRCSVSAKMHTFVTGNVSVMHVISTSNTVSLLSSTAIYFSTVLFSNKAS